MKFEYRCTLLRHKQCTLNELFENDPQVNTTFSLWRKLFEGIFLMWCGNICFVSISRKYFRQLYENNCLRCRQNSTWDKWNILNCFEGEISMRFIVISFQWLELQRHTWVITSPVSFQTGKQPRFSKNVLLIPNKVTWIEILYWNQNLFSVVWKSYVGSYICQTCWNLHLIFCMIFIRSYWRTLNRRNETRCFSTMRNS